MMQMMAGRGAVARRGLLAAAVAVLPGGRRTEAQPAPPERLAYVGSSGAEGGGITLWRINIVNGAMTLLNTFAVEAPSWLALDVQGRVLYAASDTEPDGGVTAFAVDRASGGLDRINRVRSGGARPCHLCVHPSGRFVLVAHDGSGTVAVLPVQAGGALGEATDVQGDPGPPGPAQAADSPPGQIAPNDHSGPHMRMVAVDPSGRFVFAADAGRDRILRYTLDADRGKLVPAGVPVATAPGSAPRHFAFHPNGRTFYSLQEQDGVVVVYDYDQASGGLREKQAVSALPPGFAGTFLATEIAVSPDGHFVYVAIALHDAIAVMSVAEDGRLTRIGEAWTRADSPASFTIAPDGNMMFVCNRRGNAVTAFHVERRQGALEFMGQYAPVIGPTCMVFLGQV